MVETNEHFKVAFPSLSVPMIPLSIQRVNIYTTHKRQDFISFNCIKTNTCEILIRNIKLVA